MGAKAEMASSPKNGTDVVLYLRVSTEEQAQKDLSIPAQRRALQQWAADRDYNLIAEYVEPWASARDDNRPQFRRMIGELLEGKVAAKAILVVHTSRFMRNV